MYLELWAYKFVEYSHFQKVNDGAERGMLGIICVLIIYQIFGVLSRSWAITVEYFETFISH